MSGQTFEKSLVGRSSVSFQVRRKLIFSHLGVYTAPIGDDHARKLSVFRPSDAKKIEYGSRSKVSKSKSKNVSKRFRNDNQKINLITTVQ